MPKYKLYYSDKEYSEKDNILFVNYYTDEHLNIIQNYLNKTILYDCKQLFFSNLDKIRQISRMKINIISFDGDIQMAINKIRNRKKEIIGILSSNKMELNYLTDLKKVYDIDFSENSEYFMNKRIPLCIVDIKNTPEYNKLLETRITENIHKTYIIHNSCENILYSLFINNYWDLNIDFINIYKNCYFSNKIQSYVKNEICKKYELIEKMEGPIVYFSEFNEDDCERILNYNNLIFLIWIKIGQSNKIKLIKKKNNIIHYASTKNLLKHLKNYKINASLFEINVEPPEIFKPVQKKGSKILLCDSQKYHNELVNILPEYEFIFSNKYNLLDPIIAEELYQKCFIIVRLTDYDGFLPMISELKAMNIPIVHNFSDYGLKWETIEDVKAHIVKYSPPVIEYKHQYSFDLMKDKIKNENLDMIYKNLDEICGLIGKYNNVIFISNYDDDNTIVDFIKKNNQEISIEFISCKNFEKIKESTPNLIIVKGDCEIDIYKYFNVSTIYIVDNLFSDKLDVPYWDSHCYKYINKSIIEKIRRYDISFVNSHHINKILKKFEIICKLFYWDFIPYYGKEILNNYNRKYDYGIVKGSNISNMDDLVSKNIIMDDISNIRQKLCDIKYIVYESNYDVSCQIKVDILMNGCLFNIPKYIIFRKQNRLKFKKGEEYIIKFEGCVITKKLEYGICFIEGMNDKEFIIYYYAENDLEIDEIDFIKTQKINDEIVGYNPVYLKSQDVEYLYYIYGCINNEKILAKLGLSSIFNYYSSGLLTKKYNVKLLKRKWCYDLGKNGDILNIHDFSEFVLKYSDNIISRKCLVISKKINGHGGNQKTAIQLIELLDKYFIVEVFSNNMNQNDYNLINDSLDSRIHNMKIIKKKRDEEIVDHINKNTYQFIINNKFNDYFKICDKITNPNLYVISHNSMDPFNELIIKNQNYISKVFTINKFHQNVLMYHGLKIPQKIYYNYVEKENYEVKRKKFNNRIAFIGRFTKEKNLDLLIACMRLLEDLELVVIGGDNETREENKNIIWKGVLQKDEIICELRGCDYLVVPSITEGLPFVILESMNIGIPCIYSRIIGADELIGEEGERGFTFKLKGYEDCKMKMDWSVFEDVDTHFEENTKNILKCIRDAYKISITEWNKMSKECKKFIRNNYIENKTSKKNLKSLEIIL
jgi:hypothetical protein